MHELGVEGLVVGAEKENRLAGWLALIVQFAQTRLEERRKNQGQMEDVAQQAVTHTFVDGPDQIRSVVCCLCVASLHLFVVHCFNLFLLMSRAILTNNWNAKHGPCPHGLYQRDLLSLIPHPSNYTIRMTGTRIAFIAISTIDANRCGWFALSFRHNCSAIHTHPPRQYAPLRADRPVSPTMN